MGKRLIINGADFSANGMKETYIDKTIPTVQGIVLMSGNDEGRLGTATHSYAPYYVHSGDIDGITLGKGETIAVLEQPLGGVRTSILVYSSHTSVYPANVPTSTTQTIGNYIDKIVSEYDVSSYPAAYTNNTGADVYIVIQHNKDKNDGVRLPQSELSEISYRIYAS